KSTKIAIQLDVPLRVVQRICQNWREIKDVCRKRMKIGQSPLMSPDSCKLMLGLIEHSPDIYLDEIQDELYYAHGLQLSTSTIWCTLRRLGIRNKQVHFPSPLPSINSAMCYLAFQGCCRAL
ncbi:hypothetical protein C8R41DRAFT_779538, partial [Lentinula lateritia]